MDALLYLSLDSLREGVGASQVLAYMRKVQKHTSVTIVSFEKVLPSSSQIQDLNSIGITWIPLPFGRFGAIGGIGRVFRMWLLVDRSKIIHARSTLPGLAAMLKFPKIWIWDCRSLQADQRRALSRKQRINLVFLVMRVIEHFLAKRATSIIVITNAITPILVKRYRIKTSKIHVIPTCADLEKFQPTIAPKSKKLRILFAGTFSPAYDLVLINKLITNLKKSFEVEVTIATSFGSTELWQKLDYDFLTSVPHHKMPNLIRSHDLGISVWKNDLGVCLKSVASTKTAEFLGCGKPVIINSNQGDFGELIQEHGAGVVTFGSSDAEIEGYTRRLRELIEDKRTSERCRNLAIDHFDLDQGIAKLIKIYEQSCETRLSL
jgi:glycosyltransferase involved in cell wall biosynthesis